MPIDFTAVMNRVQPGEAELIGKIVQRAVDAWLAAGGTLSVDPTMHAMDIAAVHVLCCPLKLWQWLASDNADFALDYAGISTHIDRETGRLKHGWWPQFAARPRNLNDM
jgi:hypothetical protein